MKIRVEGSHDIRTIEHVKCITIMSDDEQAAKTTWVLFVDDDKNPTIKEVIHD